MYCIFSPRWAQMIPDELRWSQGMADDPKWSQMIPDRPRWSQMNRDEPRRWSQMSAENPRWAEISPDDLKWSQTQMIPDEFRWSQMISDDPRWSQMIPNDPRWFQTIPDDPRWSQLIPDVQSRWSTKMILDARSDVWIIYKFTKISNVLNFVIWLAPEHHLWNRYFINMFKSCASGVRKTRHFHVSQIFPNWQFSLICHLAGTRASLTKSSCYDWFHTLCFGVCKTAHLHI